MSGRLFARRAPMLAGIRAGGTTRATFPGAAKRPVAEEHERGLKKTTPSAYRCGGSAGWTGPFRRRIFLLPVYPVRRRCGEQAPNASMLAPPPVVQSAHNEQQSNRPSVGGHPDESSDARLTSAPKPSPGGTTARRFRTPPPSGSCWSWGSSSTSSPISTSRTMHGCGCLPAAPAARPQPGRFDPARSGGRGAGRGESASRRRASLIGAVARGPRWLAWGLENGLIDAP